jgi:hypothetical protein
MFGMADVERLFLAGHELGCHTFDHLSAGGANSRAFEISVSRNASALHRIFPTATFRTLSYPLSVPRLLTKKRMVSRFECCRGGGQTFNAGEADLSYLAAYFLEQARGNLPAVKKMIDDNCSARGWLIFATHDVDAAAGRFGCVPDFFEGVVKYCLTSGSEVLPVAEALDLLRKTQVMETQAELP